MSKGGGRQTVNTGSQTGTSSQNQNFGQFSNVNELLNQSTSQTGTNSQTGSSSQIGNTSQLANTSQLGSTANTSMSGVDAGSQAFINQMRQLALGAAGGLLGGGGGGGDLASDPRVQAWLKTLPNDVQWNGNPDTLPDALREEIQRTGIQSAPLTVTPEMIQEFMNPALDSVVNATRGEFDNLRSLAGVEANQAATMAGAFGGSRHGVAEGVRKGELDRAQTNTIAGLRQSAFDNALAQATDMLKFRQSMEAQKRNEQLQRSMGAIQLLNMGMGPTGMVSSTSGTNALTGSNAMTGMNSMSALNNLFGTNSLFGNTMTNRTGSTSNTGFNNTFGRSTDDFRNTQTAPRGSALGGALGGAQIGSAFGPWGTAIGAGLGGLLSLF